MVSKAEIEMKTRRKWRVEEAVMQAELWLCCNRLVEVVTCFPVHQTSIHGSRWRHQPVHFTQSVKHPKLLHQGTGKRMVWMEA